MIRRRHLLAATASVLAAPAIVERANAQSAFDWKQFKGQTLEVNYQLSPRGDLARTHLKEFEALTGMTVGFEQIPEQQQRPKVAMEMATGHPSFDAVNVGMHVQKRLIEKAKWMEDLRPFIADKSLTNPDFDLADFSKPSMEVATGQDGKINVLPLNQDLFIVFYNKELLAAKGFNAPPKTYDEMMSMAHALTDPSKQVYGFVGRGLKNANVVLYDNILLGWDQETVSADGKKLLTDTPAAIEAGQWYQKIMKECGPPGTLVSTGTSARPRSCKAAPRCGGTASASLRLCWTRPNRASATRLALRRRRPGLRPTPRRRSSTVSAFRRPRRTRRRRGCSCNGSPARTC